GNDGPKTGKDSIWIGWGRRQGDITLSNVPTREAATEKVKSSLLEAVKKGEKTLVGFDFAYGFPDGLWPAIALSVGQPEEPWLSIWKLLSELANDPAIRGEDL